VFRRRSAQSPALLDQDAQPAAGPEQNAAEAPVRPGKGRPTPKRSEAQRRRRQPFAAPAGRKGAYRQSGDRDRASRASRMAAMKRGEEWALPRKDRGPVRALARDYVDSRRRLSEYYMYAVAALIILLFIPALRASSIVTFLVLAIMLVIVTEGWLVGRSVLKLARERYPGEDTRGVRLYAAMRCTQLRRLRMPAPRVKPGERI
jgi:hypothetical protein